MTPPSSRNVAVYIPGRGEIIKTLGGPDAFIAQNTPEGASVIEAPAGLAEHLFMVDESGPAPVVAPRPAFGFALPTEVALGAVLSFPAPPGAELLLDGELAGLADGEGLEVEFASPGRYLFEVRLWPYVPLCRRVEVD